MTFLRLWLILTAVVVIGLAVWAIAPIIVFLALLSVLLGILSWGIISLANALRAWNERK